MNEATSLDMCRLLHRLLESLTQVKSYHKKKAMALKAYEQNESNSQGLLPKSIFPDYKLGMSGFIFFN